jgi:3-phosphoshikimate 1-carboxyvinyltransferase
MDKTLSTAGPLHGSLRFPGDKSISHRYAILAAIAEGTSEIQNYSAAADCQSTLDCLSRLGVAMDRREGRVVIYGAGRRGLKAPAGELDAGNSGSTIRMLSGVLAGQPFRSVLVGDASLSRRPMQRIVEPLERMGARIRCASGRPPLEIEGGGLRGIHYELPVASAQVKTAVLLAGLFAEGETEVVEPLTTRDHTEIALEVMGAKIVRKNAIVRVRGDGLLKARNFVVPGDISGAAFFIVAALMVPNSELQLQGVGLNPTRTAILDLLRNMGARVEVLSRESVSGEEVGNVRVRAGALAGGEIPRETIAGLIDELPVLAVLGTQTERGIRFRGAQELRVKESDRIAAVAANLKSMGAEVEEFRDGLYVPGRQKLTGAQIPSFGDHRIAMAFAVAGLVAEGNTLIGDSKCVEISFPGFFETLESVVRP